MFGVFKKKELDNELLIKNLSDAVINTWSDESNLPFKKFLNQESFGESISKDVYVLRKFLKEKLRFTFCVLIVSAFKAGLESNVVEQVMSVVTEEIMASEDDDLKNIDQDLMKQSKQYAEIRMTTNPHDAGKQVESRFSQSVFGFTPSEDDVNASYTLYKSLSRYERDAIVNIGSAIKLSMK